MITMYRTLTSIAIRHTLTMLFMPPAFTTFFMSFMTTAISIIEPSSVVIHLPKTA